MGVDVRTIEGRRHYVVPVVMIRAGTWAGNQGPVYYSAAVLNESVGRWNGRPVVVYHPSMMGKHVSALDPFIFDSHRVGTIFNTSFDGDKLKCEAWIEADRVAKVNAKVAAAVVSGSAMNVSTGMFGDEEGRPVANAFGKAVRVATRLHPDHLAILPDQQGACSLRDGAGLNCLQASHGHGVSVPAVAFAW